MKFKKIMFSFIICVVLILNIKPAFASSILQKIEVLINGISIYVNNEQIVSDNFLYNGTSYVPLKAIAEMNGMKVNWNGEQKRVDLTSDETFYMKKTDGKYNIIGGYPRSFTDGTYLKWDYITVVFNANTKKIVDNNKVVLIDYKGNRVDVRCQPGVSAHDNFLIVTKNKLELNTYYSLYIPKDNIVMENGDLYGEEILIYFKTASNAIRGKISSSDELFGKSVIINDLNKEFSTNVVGKNEFYFSNIPSGKYEITIDGRPFGNITVEDNKINIVKVIEK